MQRLVSIAVLLLIATFLGLAAWDECELAENDCPPACHLACIDNCGLFTPPELASPAIELVALEPVVPGLSSSPSLAAPRPEIAPPRA